MRLPLSHISALILLSMMFLSCRGQISENPPIHPNQNMDFQNRFNAQEENDFYANNMAMRQPVEGTVARGNLRADRSYFEGLDENGELVEEIPVEVTREMVYRGQERYDIYCSMCHGGTGDGRGIIMTGNYGYVPAPSFHSETIRNQPDGHFYSAITNGIRNMPSYASQIKVEDRWAIVAYVRALQRSQNIQESEMERFDVNLAELMDNYREEQEREEALAEARAASAPTEVSAELGEQLFIQNACQTCHSVDGSRLVGPTFLGLYGSERTFEDGTTRIADDEYLTQSIREPSTQVVQGYANAMVSYDYLSEAEVQSLIEYIKTLSEE